MLYFIFAIRALRKTYLILMILIQDSKFAIYY